MPGQRLLAGRTALSMRRRAALPMHAAWSAVGSTKLCTSSHEARYDQCGEVADPNLTTPCHQRPNVQHSVSIVWEHPASPHLLMVVSQSALCLTPSMPSTCRHTPSHSNTPKLDFAPFVDCHSCDWNLLTVAMIFRPKLHAALVQPSSTACFDPV